jgi:hypothetical protein
MDSLKFIMRWNAASCILFGLLFLALPEGVAAFLGAFPQAMVFVLGLGLMGNGVHLIAASRRAELRIPEVIWFSLGDLSWWLATLALIVANVWITSFAGIILAVIVATCVAGLGVTQLWMLGLHASGNTFNEHLKAIAVSWTALPLWVKVWLFLLNGVFLAAFVFLPSRVAEVALIAYVATGPLLAGQLGYDGGLRRILGLAHLVPWVPFLAWLIIMLDGTMFATILIIVVAICLAFDVRDVWLFVKGDRAIMTKADLRFVQG